MQLEESSLLVHEVSQPPPSLRPHLLPVSALISSHTTPTSLHTNRPPLLPITAHNSSPTPMRLPPLLPVSAPLSSHSPPSSPPTSPLSLCPRLCPHLSPSLLAATARISGFHISSRQLVAKYTNTLIHPESRYPDVDGVVMNAMGWQTPSLSTTTRLRLGFS